MILITLLGVDLKARLILEADIVQNKAFIKILFFGLSIMRLHVKFLRFDIKRRLITFRINKKIRYIALTADASDKDSFVNYLSNPLLKALDFRYVCLNLRLGVRQDAFMSYMLMQTVKILYASMLAVIANRQEIHSEQKFICDYTENTAEMEFDGIISLTLANIIISSVKAIIKKVKMSRVEKRRINFDNKQRTEAD